LADFEIKIVCSRSVLNDSDNVLKGRGYEGGGMPVAGTSLSNAVKKIKSECERGLGVMNITVTMLRTKGSRAVQASHRGGQGSIPVHSI
jgi:hypothetical protein